jgi:patatin-like phospholipase/acyl hydrolase
MGAFSATVLAAFEEETGHRCFDYFDVMASYSVGGIIAIGLSMGKSAEGNRDFSRAWQHHLLPVR